MPYLEFAAIVGLAACAGLLLEIRNLLKAVHYMIKHEFDARHGLNDD